MNSLIIVILCFTAPVILSKAVPCGPVCDIYCAFGNVLDSDGCPTCRCKGPCEGGEAPVDGYFCGRGPNRRECPLNYFCKVAPNDAFAVCCPQKATESQVQSKAVSKPGSCPPPSDLMGICTFQCGTDSDCAGNMKCCGSCPRTCVKPQ